MSKYPEWERRIKLILAEENGEDIDENTTDKLKWEEAQGPTAAELVKEGLQKRKKSQYDNLYVSSYEFVDSGYVAAPYVPLQIKKPESKKTDSPYFDPAKTYIDEFGRFGFNDYNKSGIVAISDLRIEVDGARGYERQVNFGIDLSCGKCGTETNFAINIYASEFNSPKFRIQEFLEMILRLRCTPCQAEIDPMERGTVRIINEINNMLKYLTQK